MIFTVIDNNCKPDTKTVMVADRVNCRRCRHYFVTWEPDRPHGCRMMGFKSHLLPSVVVFQNSGRRCKAFKARQTKKPRKSVRNGD